MIYSRTGLFNWRPAGQIRPSNQIGPARHPLPKRIKKDVRNGIIFSLFCHEHIVLTSPPHQQIAGIIASRNVGGGMHPKDQETQQKESAKKKHKIKTLGSSTESSRHPAHEKKPHIAGPWHFLNRKKEKLI